MEILREAPVSSSFTPLAEHQAHTPASFYSGPPVLHHLSERCKVVILESDLSRSAALNSMRGAVAATANGHVNGSAEQEEEREVVIDGVDVWVASQKLLLYAASASAGVAIPYPSISLHAIQRLRVPGADSDVQGLYMQLATQSGDGGDGAEDEDMDSVSLSIVPAASAEEAAPAAPAAGEENAEDDLTADDEKPVTPTQALFAALSACSNLHPDPPAPGEEGDEEEGGEGVGSLAGSSLFQAGLVMPGNNAGGLPPPMDGSSGWITAENVHEYFDEDGNWKGDHPEADEAETGEGVGDEDENNAPLGPGAGTVRPREDGGDASAGDAGDSGLDETKWRRTD